MTKSLSTLLLSTLLTLVPAYGYESKYVVCDDEKLAKRCDDNIERIIERYCKPRFWEKFPVVVEPFSGRYAGYTQSDGGKVIKLVVCAGYLDGEGKTLSHELTHATFFYILGKNFDLFFNEGLAENSEWGNRSSLRTTVFNRRNNGEFVSLSSLYGRNSYDGTLLIYHEGFTTVDYLVGLGGSKYFAAFLDAITNDDSGVDYWLRAFYGIDGIDELQKRVFEYVDGGQDRLSIGGLLNVK